MTQQVLDRPVVRLSTYETFIADIIRRGWLRYYDQAILEVAQSAQRLTRSTDLRSEHHEVSAEKLEGIPVARVNRDNFIYVVNEATETSPATVATTLIPWYIATELTYRNIFFEFRLERVGRVLYTSNVTIDENYFKTTH